MAKILLDDDGSLRTAKQQQLVGQRSNNVFGNLANSDRIAYNRECKVIYRIPPVLGSGYTELPFEVHWECFGIYEWGGFIWKTGN